MEALTKRELIKNLSARTGLTQKQVKKVLDGIFSEIASCLVSGKAVKILGFGSFSVYERKERKGINPRTGEEIVIPARRAIRFKPSKNLRKACID